MAAAGVRPAKFGNAGFSGRCTCGVAGLGVDCKLEIQPLAAAVAIDLPVVDCQLAEYRAAGHRGPLAGRVDQMSNLVHCQSLRQLTAALEGHYQHVATANRAAVPGDLIAT